MVLNVDGWKYQVRVKNAQTLVTFLGPQCILRPSYTCTTAAALFSGRLLINEIFFLVVISLDPEWVYTLLFIAYSLGQSRPHVNQPLGCVFSHRCCCCFQAKLEEAEAQAKAQEAANRSSDRSEKLEAEIAVLRDEHTELLEATNRSSDRSKKLEAEIAVLRNERTELQASHQAALLSCSEALQTDIALLREECSELRAAQQDTLRSEGLARTQLQEEHDESVSALKSTISEVMDAVELKEAELTELSQKRDELLVGLERERERAGVAAERLNAVEDRLREAEERLAEAHDAVRFS